MEAGDPAGQVELIGHDSIVAVRPRAKAERGELPALAGWPERGDGQSRDLAARRRDRARALERADQAGRRVRRSKEERRRRDREEEDHQHAKSVGARRPPWMPILLLFRAGADRGARRGPARSVRRTRGTRQPPSLPPRVGAAGIPPRGRARHYGPGTKPAVIRTNGGPGAHVPRGAARGSPGSKKPCGLSGAAGSTSRRGKRRRRAGARDRRFAARRRPAGAGYPAGMAFRRLQSRIALISSAGMCRNSRNS